jgi:hypothetical protein
MGVLSSEARAICSWQPCSRVARVSRAMASYERSVTVIRSQTLSRKTLQTNERRIAE